VSSRLGNLHGQRPDLESWEQPGREGKDPWVMGGQAHYLLWTIYCAQHLEKLPACPVPGLVRLREATSFPGALWRGPGAQMG
jgi:hypothetical protein